MHEEIAAIAVVQNMGVVEDGAVTAKPFADAMEAWYWLKNEIEAAHGADVVEEVSLGGLIRIYSTEGPTQGWVIACGEGGED